MPRSYRVADDANYAYFVTCSVVDWLPLFENPAYRQIILNSLYCRASGQKTCCDRRQETALKSLRRPPEVFQERWAHWMAAR